MGRDGSDGITRPHCETGGYTFDVYEEHEAVVRMSNGGPECFKIGQGDYYNIYSENTLSDVLAEHHDGIAISIAAEIPI